MKKLVATLLAAALMVSSVFCLTSCGGEKGPQTTFKPTGESKGELIVGFDAEYPPYGYLDTDANEYAGFDIEYAKAVCEHIGYTLKLVPIDWNSKDLELESGNINCIWNGFTMNDREDLYQWTRAYVDNSIVILTSADSGIATLADLAGKTVTVQDGSSGKTALENNETGLVDTFADGKFLTCADYTAAFQELKTGAVDAIAIDVGVAKHFISENEGFTILDEAIASEQYAVGFFLGNTELCSIIEEAMVYVAENTDTVTTLAEKYGIADAVTIGK